MHIYIYIHKYIYIYIYIERERERDICKYILKNMYVFKGISLKMVHFNRETFGNLMIKH